MSSRTPPFPASASPQQHAFDRPRAADDEPAFARTHNGTHGVNPGRLRLGHSDKSGSPSSGSLSRIGLAASDANKRINNALRELHRLYRPGGERAVPALSMVQMIARRLVGMHTATLLSVLCLVISTAATPINVTLLSIEICLTVVFVYGTLIAVEAFFLWARHVELRRRVIYTLSALIGEDADSDRVAFHGSYLGLRGLLASRSFNLVQVLRDRNVVCVPEALLLDGDEALDRRANLGRSTEGAQGATSLRHEVADKGITVPVRRFDAPQKSFLFNALTDILECTPIQLAALPPTIRPAASPQPQRVGSPAMPHPPSPSADSSSSESSTETDDDGAVPRSSSLPVSPSNPTEQMEYFVYRSLGLLWVVLVAVLAATGWIYARADDELIWERVLLQPVVALLGLMPFSALFVGRVWGLWSNLVLVSRLKWLLRHADRDDDESDSSSDEGGVLLEVAEGRHDVRRVLRRLVQMLRVDGSGATLCFTRSPVHTLGSATVIASLDGEGTLTEAVLVPLRLLYIKPRPAEVPEAVAAADADGEADDPETADLPREIREALATIKRERAKRQRAQTYGEKRFKQVALHHAPSSDRSKVVTFVESVDADGSLAPLGLCALLHSVHATSALRGRDAPHTAGLVLAHALDECVLWGRSMHWLSRALDIPDAIATRFRLVRRVFMLDRAVSVSHEPKHLRPRVLPVSQKCGLFFEAPGGELHVYVIGTMSYVMDACITCWDGQSVGALSHDDNESMATMANRWPSRACRVGCAFRVLPERYREFITVPDAAQQDGDQGKRHAPRTGVVVEDYFVDGVMVHSTHPPPEDEARHQHHHRHRHRHRYHGARHRRTLSDGDASAAAASPVEPLRTPQQKPAAAAELPPPLDGAAPLHKEKDLLEPDSRLDPTNAALKALTGQLTFIGVAGLFDFVRPKVESSIATLDNAGIRFVHIGAGTLQEARSFGARLGLKDEHNNCISLRKDDPTIDDAYSRARLPRGVPDIRRHLVTTDAIPLKVPMFCGARSRRTRAMISVMQDNHEVVAALASPLNHTNTRAMIQADIAVCAEPCLRRGAAVDGEDVINRPADETFFRPDPNTADNLQSLARLLGTAGALSLTPTTQTLPMVVSLIRQARLLLKQLAQCTDFIVQVGCGVTMLHSLTLVLTGGPLLMSPAQTLIVLNVMAPIVGFGVAYTPKDVDVMVLMPSKHDAVLRVEMVLQWAVWFTVRYLPTTVVVLVVGIGSHQSYNNGQPLVFRRNTEFETPAVEATQALCTISLAYILCWLSRTFLSRHTTVPLYRFDPLLRERERCALTCRRWLLCSVISFLVVVIGVIATTDLGAWDLFVNHTPMWAIALVLLWPIVQGIIDVPLKANRQAKYSFQQSLLRARFKTRLGMYSPVGSEDAFQAPEERNPTEEDKERVNPIVRFLVRWISIDGGMAEQQCVCHERGLG